MAVELRNSDDVYGDATLGAAIDRLSRARTDSGLFFDFDGVLAPIQGSPEFALPTAGAVTVLEALSGLVKTITIVSSRNAEFLQSHLGGIGGLRIYGLYGLEHVRPDGTIVVDPAAQEWLDVAHKLWYQASEALPDVYVEDKKLSVGLHYRKVPQAQDAVESWALQAAERTGFTVQPGRMAVELKPPLPVDKGSTVARLIRELTVAWYFGDDIGDVPAFVALHDRAEADPDFSGLAIGVGNDTIVDIILDRADVFLGSPALVVELLHHLREELSG